MAKKVARSKTGKRKTPKFQGRIVNYPAESLTAFADVKIPRPVLFPKSMTDVATAVALSQNEKLFVRSGMQAQAVTDRVDPVGGVVLNLADLNVLDVTKGVINAEAGTTTGEMTKLLTKHGLALPLADNPQRSIAASVIHEGPSCLMRTLGPLSGYVSKLSVVTPVGKPVTRSGASALPRSRANSDIITRIAFKPASGESLLMFRRSFPYPGKDQFALLAKALFLNTKIPAHSDLVLDAFSARHGLSVIRITATCSTAEDKAALEALVANALGGLPKEFEGNIIAENYYGSRVIKSIVDAGFAVPEDPGIDTHELHQIVAADTDRNEALNGVTGQIHSKLAFSESRHGMLDKDRSLFIRIQLNRENSLELSSSIYTPRAVQTSFSHGLESLSPLTRATAPALKSVGLFAAVAPRIPGFRGDVFIPSDRTFKQRAKQYATSSYPTAQMTPFMVAYPLDAADIQAAIQFARGQGKRVVARSGGHQYTGKSSGDNSTIVLSLDAFNHFRDISGNIVEVGPGVGLTTLAAGFKGRGITIPHGECPLVCVGGHAQTGGFGHFLRGFGLALDYVTAFTIILADGSIRTVQRPAGAPTPGNLDEELFWGVLGGNAGSFGIVINYRIECIKDSDHRESYGYAATRRYEFNRYRSLMKEVQAWTKQVVAGTLRTGIDFTMTVESSSAFFLPPLLLVELVNSNLAGEPVDGGQPFQSIIQIADANAGFPWGILTTEGRQPLSTLADSFVRRPPSTTWDGREFKYPYKKRVNCTMSALTDKFVDQFVGLVEEVVNDTDGVYLVFQMMIGGGNYKNSARRLSTSIPQREFVFSFVFDLFYDDGFEQTAEDLQQRMQLLVDIEFSPGQEKRLFWGSFGDTDMTKQSVIDLYYDNHNNYTRLKALKARIDPRDTFHTQFTVQL